MNLAIPLRRTEFVKSKTFGNKKTRKL